MSAATTHPFQTRPSAARRSETAVFWLFRGATYFVLLCGALVFLNIFVKGSKTVFRPTAPFVNTEFFTASPESLYLFEWEGQKREMGDKEFRAFKEAHPAAANVKAESYVYCAGGIFPCIVGTVLLVAGSMGIALFLGVSAAIYLNEYARDTAAVRFADVPSPNLFVAGEMMAGNVLGKGYTAGVGMTIGTAFGRIAGTQAAQAALSAQHDPVKGALA